ncbi:MAG: aspartate aminotransferase family protein [Gemmatimonadetes bacterium]|nr:aspartate aminotransferase family protein [Gemmatimonadota bacterium]
MPSSRSEALFDQAREVMPSGYTRHMVVAKPYPQYADYGAGCRIIDVDGRSTIDFVNNFTALIHGHSKKEIVEVIAAQAGRLLSAILPTEWEVRLAELLVERIPGVEQVRFTNTGSEAVMIAVKVARAYTGKPKIAKMEGGYHGQFDLIEASFQPPPDRWGDPARPTAVANNVGTPQSLLDELVLLPVNDIENTRARLRADANQIAAVIIDPNRLQLGMVEPRADYLAMLRDETARLGIVLIFDEVIALRNSYHGTQGLLGITPDLTTMGKIIGGGMPIGALGGTIEAMSVFNVDSGEPKVKHSGTFTANPLSMATGHVGMSLLTREAFDDLSAKGQRLRDGLERVRRDLGIVGRVEGRTSMSALMMTDQPVTNYRQLSAVMASGLLAKTQAYQKLLLAEGVLTLRGGFIGSTPMTNDDIDFTIEAARRALTKLIAA